MSRCLAGDIEDLHGPVQGVFFQFGNELHVLASGTSSYFGAVFYSEIRIAGIFDSVENLTRELKCIIGGRQFDFRALGYDGLPATVVNRALYVRLEFPFPSLKCSLEVGLPEYALQVGIGEFEKDMFDGDVPPLGGKPHVLARNVYRSLGGELLAPRAHDGLLRTYHSAVESNVGIQGDRGLGVGVKAIGELGPPAARALERI